MPRRWIAPFHGHPYTENVAPRRNLPPKAKRHRHLGGYLARVPTVGRKSYLVRSRSSLARRCCSCTGKQHRGHFVIHGYVCQRHIQVIWEPPLHGKTVGWVLLGRGQYEFLKVGHLIRLLFEGSDFVPQSIYFAFASNGGTAVPCRSRIRRRSSAQPVKASFSCWSSTILLASFGQVPLPGEWPNPKRVAEVTLRCGVYSSICGIKMHFQFVGAVILGLTLSPASKTSHCVQDPGHEIVPPHSRGRARISTAPSPPRLSV
jgi:hypothetical protein